MPGRTRSTTARRRAAAALAGGTLLLAACGGGSGVATRSMTVPVTTGPIASACAAAGRSGASRVRCGCIQAVADRALSRGDQRRGAAFFDDPHRAQEVRQSDRAGDEAFWERWKVFAAGAERVCRAT